MMTSESLEERRSKELQAYKRSPELNNSKWYKGMLHSQMAGTEDNNGAFDLVLIKARPGVEPPPHLHSREHEAMYLLSGEIAFYIETEVFTAKAGEYVFIPRGKRHAFLITSEKAEVMLYVSPGGFYGAFNKMSVPAQRMEMPNGADALTYADEDLTETIKTFQQYGTRFLTPEEIRGALPEYPL
jgi:quercetin dioxygenase-like cupin family protein